MCRLQQHPQPAPRRSDSRRCCPHQPAHSPAFKHGKQGITGNITISVWDPDPHVLGRQDPDPLVRGMDPDPDQALDSSLF
jgi:hypothetical protein